METGLKHGEDVRLSGPCVKWQDTPVLIYGPRKAGTTLVQNLVDGGNEIVCYPSEMKLKYYKDLFFPPQPEAVRLFYSRSEIIGKEYGNFDSGSYERLVKEPPAEASQDLGDLLKNDMSLIYQNIRTRPRAPKMWAIKEVGGNAIQVMCLFRHLFLSGKVIFVVRDPLMITRSVILQRKRRGTRLGLKKLFYETVDPLKVLSHIYRRLDDESVHFVSYENITGGGLDEEMKGVCRYLGISFNDIFKRTTIFGVPVVTATSSKETKEVFHDDAAWYEGLSLRERAAVLIFSFIARKIMAFKGRPILSYDDVAEKILRRRNTLAEEGM